MIYLIGGVARCGKSTLAKSLLAELPAARYLSGDSFRYAIKPLLEQTTADIPPATNDEDAYVAFYVKRTARAVAAKTSESNALWPYLLRFIDAHAHETSQDLIVESAHLLPELVAQLPYEHRAIFLVNTDAQQWRQTLATPGENDWMSARGLTSKQRQAWSQFAVLRSQSIRSSAQQCNYPVLNLADSDFKHTQTAAKQLLLQ